ncbi:MAG: hypothetical protein JOZ84_01545 [Methylobacteriaceae bacterium]|nr:hypothetical protein [Methylobacteriaceae bacterium]
MRSYLLKVLACALAAISIVGALVLFTDAFALFGTRLLPTKLFPHTLRMTTSGDRVIKATEIAYRREPLDILFAGSSRVAFAFDPRSPSLREMQTYNAGLNGSHSYETSRIVRYAIDHVRHIRRIVWNIDFEEFFRPLSGEADFAHSAFARTPLALGYARHLLSYEALRKSADAAISALRGGFFPYIDVDGFYIHERSDAARGAIDYPLMPRLRNFYPDYVFSGQERYAELLDARLADLDATLAYAKARGVDIDIVLMPVHVTRLTLYQVGGLLPLCRSWEQALAQNLARAAELPGSGTIRAFDFSLLTPVSLEDFPLPDSGKHARFFLETLHPGPVVGDMIVARLLDRPSPLEIPGFGAPLEEAVTPERFAEDDAKLRAWENAHPELVRQIEALVAQERLSAK